MPWWGDAVVGLVILLAAVGCVVPLLPGGLLALSAIAVWSVVEGGVVGWSVLIVSALLIAVGQVVKYLWPTRSLNRSGVAGRSLIIGGALGIIGFFVVPLIGLPLGFVAGIFVAECVRQRRVQQAKDATVAAMRATGLSMLIELASVLLAGTVWTAGVLALA